MFNAFFFPPKDFTWSGFPGLCGMNGVWWKAVRPVVGRPSFFLIALLQGQLDQPPTLLGLSFSIYIKASGLKK